jgi:GH18 family chitinase
MIFISIEKMMCYYDKTSTKNGYFQPKKIRASLCTHIIYAYVGVKPDGTIKIDNQVDIVQGIIK